MEHSTYSLEVKGERQKLQSPSKAVRKSLVWAIWPFTTLLLSGEFVKTAIGDGFFLLGTKYVLPVDFYFKSFAFAHLEKRQRRQR